MALNINGTTGISGVDGTVSAPALTGTDSNTGITFPSADTIKFSTGGVERMSITNSGVTGAGGKFASYAIIGDQKSSGTAGGALTSGDWRTHDLQTEFSDTDGIVSISSNQFTLQAGTYLITYRTIAYAVASSVAKIYNVTDSADVANSFSQSVYARNSSGHTIPAIGSVRFTISGAKVFELRQQGTTTHASAGFGVASSFSVNNYAIIEIFKET